jgi:hypothetical protein
VARRPADGRRPTKAERREEARFKRDELRRRAERRKRNRRILGVVGVLAVVAAVIVIGILQGSGFPSAESLLARAPGATAAAGCEAVTTVEPFDPKNITGEMGDATPEEVDRAHIGAGTNPTMPPFDRYPSIPPTSGPHADIPPGPWPAGVYDSPPPMDRVIHSLEHGAAVIWYDPAAPEEEISRITGFYTQRLIDAQVGQDRVIVAPYDYPDQGGAGRLPAGATMALVSWHRLQTCARPDLAVAFSFTARFAAPPSGGLQYEGEAPEPGGAL